MKLLFDQNISFRIKRKLLGSFPESVHVSDVGLQNSTDSDIWNFARVNNFSIVTFDIDFLNLGQIKGYPPKIILLKLGNNSTTEIANVLERKAALIKSFLSNSNFNDVFCLEIV